MALQNITTPQPSADPEAIKAAIIATQNDQFRAALILGINPTVPGKVLITPGVMAEGPTFLAMLQIAVATFDTFTEDNDPYGDHTFGLVKVCETQVYWKIDLYDEDYQFGSEEPENPEKTRRVLTLLLPSEY